MAFENKGATTVTVLVAASNSLNQNAANIICSGAADNIEIQEAIDSLPAGGGKVILLDGLYTVDKAAGEAFAIGIPDNTEFEMLQGAVIRLANNQDCHVISNSDIVGGNENIYIHGGTIDGNKAGQTLPMGAIRGIVLSNVDEATIEHVRIQDTGANGIYTEFSSYIAILDCTLSGTGDDAIAINEETFHSAVIGNIVIDTSNDRTDSSMGIEVQDGSHDISIIGNIIRNPYMDGIGVYTHAGKPGCYNITIQGNTIYNSDVYGIRVSAVGGSSAAHDISIVGNTIDGVANTSAGIYVEATVSHNCSVVGNTISNTTSRGMYIEMDGAVVTSNSVDSAGAAGIGVLADYVTVTGNRVTSATGVGIHIEAGSYCTITGNTVSGGASSGIYANETNHTIVGNVAWNNATIGIYVAADYSVVSGNICTDNDTGIQLAGDYNSACDNICDNTGGGVVQRYGILCTGDYNKVYNNRAFNNTVEQIRRSPTADGTILYEQYSDLFMDVLAVSANHVVNAQTLAADPTVCAIAAQPDVPRTLSYTITHPTLTAFTLTFVGVNAKGEPVTEVFTQATGWTGETGNAFATVTSITMSAMTGNTVADTIDVGITDVLGLSNVIYATGDVYKIKKNNANAVAAAAQVNVTYDTYDMAVIGLAVGDDFTIWFRSNLNVVA